MTFHLARAAVGTASATTLGTTVPTGATSGRISVAHPGGAVQSTADFFVPPPDFTVAHVADTGRLVMGGSDISALLNAGNKIGLLVFDGSAGQPVSLGVLQVNNYAAAVTVMRPDGATVLYQPVGPGNPARDLHIASLPVTGTYTILLTTGGPDTFTVTLSQDLTLVPIAINATVAFSVTRRAQRTPLTFSGTAGQRLTVAITSATVGAQLTVIKPDGTALLTGGNLQSPTGAVDLPVLPSAGTYTVFIDPNNAGTGSMNVTLSEDVAATITIGGAAVPVSITQPGQRARATFTGTAGQLINVGLTGSTIANGAWASILKPDGTGLASASFGTTDAAVDGSLPVTGSYTVLIDPGAADTGNITLTLSEEATSSITPGGSAVPVSLTRAGQRGRLFFSGTTGQRMSVQLSDRTIGDGAWMLVKPDGALLGSSSSIAWTTFGEPQSLPVTGTYAILIDPTQAYTGNITVRLHDVPADITGTLSVNGAAVPTTLSPGQQGTWTFPGTVGQAITVRGANNTMGCADTYLTTPSGSTSSGTQCAATWSMGNTATQNGTYTFRLDPNGANAGSVDLSVTSP